MIFQKGSPTLRGRPSMADHILTHARLPDIDAQLQQFAVDARSSPKRVLAAHLSDQLTHFHRHRRTARLTVSNFPCPEPSEALPVPGNDGFRLDDDHRRSPIVPNV